MRPDLEQENNYYKNALHSKLGTPGLEYLRQRGIAKETIEKWELGWSPLNCIPDNFDKDDKSKPWIKLWGRLTIPIRDSNGVLISISGRQVIKLGDKPKYDHYPFSARKILFGLFNNKEDIRKADRIIITEGQMDVISSWQSGLKIVASSFGAHGSLDHFAVASRYASVIDILYDEDNAGKIGTDNINKFPTWGDLIVNLRTDIFPRGEDLDSWIRKHSSEELLKLIDGSKNNEYIRKINFLKNRK